MPANGNATKESIARMVELVTSVQALADPVARDAAIELVQAVMTLHAEALERILEVAGASSPGTVEAMAADELVTRVLVLHGLHPDDAGKRLARALDALRQHFDSRGARLDVLEAGPDVVRVRFTGKRPGSGRAARQLIEDGIYEAVPEVESLIIEGTENEQDGFVPLTSLFANQPV